MWPLTTDGRARAEVEAGDKVGAIAEIALPGAKDPGSLVDIVGTVKERQTPAESL